ncbi:porin family protein [Fibrivirga algicola]|uniref:PorT family protein n=1 Tax=Fibrivirga algicola TaxID=2950420 RepID=A0ABX0QLP4_9BACT|nr:porin family protein [Fibrivirga algicola]ARK10447.1 hypothetical protein A6C57_08965 [Fibrella sp. ES10-3-2-2]NID11947.1 PorT family protein [Fibrivirga algicola]
MIRICLAIAIFCLCVTSTNGQVRYGIQGSIQGANVSSVVDFTSFGPSLGTLAVPINQRIGFRAGIMADCPITSRLSVRPQLLYSVKGGDVDVKTFVGNVLSRFGVTGTPFIIDNPISKVVVNYVELPVVLLYQLATGPGHLVVGAGPYAAVAIGGSINGAPINFDTSSFRKHDLGATASLGYDWPNGLSLSGYYAHGLTNFSRNSTPNLSSLNPSNPTASLDPSAFGGTLRNRSYGITVGYFF